MYDTPEDSRTNTKGEFKDMLTVIFPVLNQIEMTIKNNIFYTYIYLDSRKPGRYQYGDYLFEFEPMYVGKGKGSRWREHLGYYKNWLGYKIKHIKDCGLEPKVIFQEKNLDEQSAFKSEIDLIIIIGRRDLGTGPLVNLTKGGDGVSGYIHSEKQKENFRGKNNPMYGKVPWNKGKKFPEYSGMNHPNYGKLMSEEQKKKISLKVSGENNHNYGKKRPEHSIKLSGRKNIKRQGIPPWNKGKVGIYSEETLEIWFQKRSGEGNYMYGKHHSKETKKKMTEASSKRFQNSRSREKLKGKNNSFYGKHHSEETKKKMSEKRKEYYKKRRENDNSNFSSSKSN